MSKIQFNDAYYPKLPTYGTTGIKQSWQYMVRCRIRKQFSLEQILEKNLEATGKTSILKEICHRELLDCIKKRKKNRNAIRLELGKVGFRLGYPQDVVNNIFTFTRFL